MSRSMITTPRRTGPRTAPACRALATAAVLIALTAAAPASQEVRRRMAPPGPEAARVPDGGVEVPMRFRGPMPAVEVMVNGKGPFLFALDTGAAGCGRADVSLVKELDLEPRGKALGADGSGRTGIEMSIHRLDSLQIGEARFEGLDVLSRDYNQLAPPGWDRIDGIVGIGLFENCLLTLDYANRKVRIEPGSLPEPDGKTVLEWAGESPIPNVTIRLGDHELPAHLDSGNTAGIRVPPSALEHVEHGPVRVAGRARSVSGEFEIRETRLETPLQFGAYTIERPLVNCGEGGPPSANLGSSVLREFVTTYDMANRRVRFARQGDTTIRVEPTYRVGLLLAPQGDTLRVVEVVAGGAAADAGLEAEDVIVAVNGRPLAEVQGELGELLGSPAPVRLTLKRGGETLEIEVTPRATE